MTDRKETQQTDEDARVRRSMQSLYTPAASALCSADPSYRLKTDTRALNAGNITDHQLSCFRISGWRVVSHEPSNSRSLPDRTSVQLSCPLPPALPRQCNVTYCVYSFSPAHATFPLKVLFTSLSCLAALAPAVSHVAPHCPLFNDE